MSWVRCEVGMASVATTVSGSYTGTATANLVIERHVFAETVMLPAGLTGSQGTAGGARPWPPPPASQRTARLPEPGCLAAGATTASFTMGSSTTYVAGDI